MDQTKCRKVKLNASNSVNLQLSRRSMKLPVLIWKKRSFACVRMKVPIEETWRIWVVSKIGVHGYQETYQSNSSANEKSHDGEPCVEGHYWKIKSDNSKKQLRKEERKGRFVGGR